MLDFFKSLFRPAPPSGETAKERLRLVLLSDHLSLAPDVVELLKRDLLEVISRYVEIDPDHADVTFEQRDRELAMLASVPITAVRDRPRPSGDLPFATTPSNGHGAASLFDDPIDALDEPAPEEAPVASAPPEAMPHAELPPHTEAPHAEGTPHAEAMPEAEAAPQPHAEPPAETRDRTAVETRAETAVETRAETVVVAGESPQPETGAAPARKVNGSRRRRRKKYAAAVAQAKRATQNVPLGAQASAQA